LATDKEIAQRVQNMQNNGRDVPLMRLPGYMAWSEKKLDEGVSEALIANLDALSMFLLPEEDATIGVKHYEELLEDLKDLVDE
jgi:hypothetical protein